MESYLAEQILIEFRRKAKHRLLERLVWAEEA